MEQNITLHKWTDAYGNMLSAQSREGITYFPYRQIVGSLLYLAIWTRPDIAYALHSVAKHCANPTLEAMHACRRILGYIKITLHLGLSLHPGDLILKSFVHSSFSNDSENRKSTAGLIQYLRHSPIYWETFVANTTIPLSTAEAEYVAAHIAGKAIMATTHPLVELKNCPSIRDLIRKGHVDIIYIHISLQVADIFTKALGIEPFLKHRIVLLESPPTDELAVYLKSTQDSHLDQRTEEDIDNFLHYPPNWQQHGCN